VPPAEQATVGRLAQGPEYAGARLPVIDMTGYSAKSTPFARTSAVLVQRAVANYQSGVLMAAVVVQEGLDWTVSRWIFRAVLDRALTRVSEDPELDYWLHVGIANDMLDLGFIDADIGRRLLAVLSSSAEQELELAGADLAPEDRHVYLRAVGTLREALGSVDRGQARASSDDPLGR
jgi:hypothetical protein